MKMTKRRNGGGLFYRRKILLALLQAFGGKLTKMDLQKLLFLLAQMQEDPSYDFIPYKYGCYSFQSAADKRTMMKYKLLEEEKDWVNKSSRDYLAMIDPIDRRHILELRMKFGNLRGTGLIRYVYTQYPYYAIHSTIADSILTPSELERVDAVRPAASECTLFTIGYEGKTLEEYLKQLIDSSVKILCDVRRNPISMKFGFSKNQLRGAAESLGILYVHLPGLGIASSKRQNLETVDDYEELFKEYEQKSLPKQQHALQKIVDLMRAFGRVSLTCFERDADHCHRGRVARALQRWPNWKYAVEHL